MQSVIYTFTGSFLAIVFIVVAVILLICVAVYLEVDWIFKKTPLDARKDIEKLYNRIISRYAYAYSEGPAESYKVTDEIVKKELEEYLADMQELLKSYFPTR